MHVDMKSLRISMQTKVAVFVLLSLLAVPATAFLAPLLPHAHAVSTKTMMTPSTRGDIRSTARRTREMASDGINNEASTSTGKRRKRKDGVKVSPPTSFPEADNSSRGPLLVESSTQNKNELKSPSPAPAAVPKESVVVMKVRDIRDVVSGTPEPAVKDEIYASNLKAQVEIGNSDDDDDDDDDELAEDEEWEYFDVDDDGNENMTYNEREERKESKDDSIEQLLADARQMRRAKPVGEGEAVDSSSSSVKNAIFEVISTIVTVDFFLVIGLLAWFLAGIFCSSVLHNDAVQIAFNMNFERVTQPALGILMIGSVAGALGNKEEEE